MACPHRVDASAARVRCGSHALPHRTRVRRPLRGAAAASGHVMRRRALLSLRASTIARRRSLHSCLGAARGRAHARADRKSPTAIAPSPAPRPAAQPTRFTAASACGAAPPSSHALRRPAADRSLAILMCSRWSHLQTISRSRGAQRRRPHGDRRAACVVQRPPNGPLLWSRTTRRQPRRNREPDRAHVRRAQPGPDYITGSQRRLSIRQSSPRRRHALSTR